MCTCLHTRGSDYVFSLLALRVYGNPGYANFYSITWACQQAQGSSSFSMQKEVGIFGSKIVPVIQGLNNCEFPPKNFSSISGSKVGENSSLFIGLSQDGVFS